LSNAPATFHHVINNTRQAYLDIFFTAYLDNIVIYRDSLEEGKVHMLQVLETL
jgi:hypothetical protein